MSLYTNHPIIDRGFILVVTGIALLFGVLLAAAYDVYHTRAIYQQECTTHGGKVREIHAEPVELMCVDADGMAVVW